MAMQLRGLRAFCLAARHLSFKKAADEMCLTPSAVSHQISDLEDELGVRLFERQTRAISLTPVGLQFYEEVAQSLAAIDGAADRVKKISQRVPLLVQMPEFFASELLMPIIGGFSDRHQHIDLRIESMDAGGEANPDADINILLSRHRPPAARVARLFPIRYIPACSQGLFAQWKRKGFSDIDAIRDSTILLHKARPQAWSRWARHVGIGDLKPRQIIYVDSMFALARAAQRGVGIALVPMPVSKAWFDSGELVPLHDTALVTEDYYWMALNEATDNREATDVFWQWISENLRHYADHMDQEYSSVA